MDAPNTTPRKNRTTAGLTFLIVDDDEYYAKQLSYLVLKASGQSEGVRLVATVEDALAWVENHATDVCFLDFSLLEKAGLETENMARLANKMPALVFFAETPCKSSALRALSFGAKDFLIKSNVSEFDIAKSIAYALYWKLREIEMEAHAVRDNVTGLGNVPLFDEHLRHALEVAKRGKERVGLLMIGVEGMKAVHEDYGNDVSDELLKQVGERISTKVRSSDVVARLDGDQFGAVLTKVASPAVVKTISGSLTEALSVKPYNINGYALKVGATIGESTYPDDGDDLDALKDTARQAIAAKQIKRKQQTTRRPYDYYT